MSFLYLLVLIPLVAGQNSGIPGTQCGGVICLQGNDVTCIPENNECKCKDGLVGNGRFACVDKAKSCVCYLYGDPHVTAFSTSVTAINLPCNHKLAEFTTPNGITVKVSAMGSQRNDRNYPGFVFEDALFFEAKKGSTVATALFKRDGFWNKGLKVTLPFSSTFPEFGVFCSADANQYWRLELPGQGIVVRYRSADSSVTIEAPKDSVYVSERPCGACQDDGNTYTQLAQTAGLNKNQWSLMNAFANLDPENEANPVCKALNDAYNGCSISQKKDAVVFCGAPFSNSNIGTCFSQVYGKAAILGKVENCISDFCSGKRNVWCGNLSEVQNSCNDPQVQFAELTAYCAP